MNNHLVRNGTMYTRSASHAGSWYEGELEPLERRVQGLLSKISATDVTGQLLALIGPHAGIQYSGATCAHSYAVLSKYLLSPAGSSCRRIFVIGPAHHKWMPGAQASGASFYATAWGNIAVDREVIDQLLLKAQQGGIPFSLTSRETDEEEHSLEMHFPFIGYILKSASSISTRAAVGSICVVPIILGGREDDVLRQISRLLQPYFGDPENIFVFSSDFCHWGQRFRYTYHYEPTKYPTLCESIQAMDEEGLRHIESQSVDRWTEYLRRTGNTICGMRPLTVLLHLLQGRRATVTFRSYAQSSAVKTTGDSSVSYAAGIVVAAP